MPTLKRNSINNPKGIVLSFPTVVLRRPTDGDGYNLHQLVARCQPLDTNSVYCNLLQCSDFADTAIAAENAQGELVGFISGYRPPARPDTLFVWQVAVDSSMRGQGLALRMLLALTGFEAIFNAASNNQNAAEVNGEEISRYELDQAMNMQRRQLAQQLGQDFDASLLDDRLFRDSALGSLIDRMLLLQSAKSANFAFSSEALDQLILQTPEFQVDGAFSAARFNANLSI